MPVYRVTVEIAGSVEYEIEAVTQERAEELAIERAERMHDVEYEVTDCRPLSVEDAAVDEELDAIARVTLRQFCHLVTAGVTASRIAYEHETITTRDVVERIERVVFDSPRWLREATPDGYRLVVASPWRLSSAEIRAVKREAS